MAAIGETVGKVTGNIDWSTVTPKIFSGITILIIVFIVAIIFSIMGYFFIMSLRYKNKITIFENVNGGNPIPNIRDRAMQVKIGPQGLRIFWLKKLKEYAPADGDKIGKNHYAYERGPNGVLIPIIFKSDNKGEMHLVALERDMDLFTEAIKRLNSKRFDKTSFISKYGPVIAVIGSFVIMGIILWLVGSKLVELPAQISPVVDKLDKVMEKADAILAKAANIENGGTGFKPAQWMLPLYSR